MSDRASLVQIYIAFYNRAPDPEGLAFWQAVCDGGLSLEAIADLFVPQDESIGTYPFLGNPSEAGIRSFLQDVYQNLFNRDLDAAGETFWTEQILKSINEEPGGLSIGEVVLSIITGAQGDDITTLANKTTVALDWHDQAAQVPDYVQSDAATTASRLALSVVDETDFSVVQGEVLNENFFEALPSTDLTPFVPGEFAPQLAPGETGLDEVQANGFINSFQAASKVVALSDGKVVVAYEDLLSPGDREVAFRIFNPDGSILGRDTYLLGEPLARTIGTGTENHSMTALPDGGFLIFAETRFENGADKPDGLYAFHYTGLGEPVGGPILVVDDVELDDVRETDVTYLPTGNILYTYADRLRSPDEEDVLSRILTLEGEDVTEVQTVNEETEDDFSQSSVASATLPDGTTLIVYRTDDRSIDGSSFAILGRFYDAQGNALDEPFLVNEFGSDFQTAPAVAALGDDHFVVVFSTRSREFDPSSFGVSGIILDRNGDPEVGEFPVNDETRFAQVDPQVAELADGGFVVVWASQEDGRFDIRARIFDEEGDPVTGDIEVNTFLPENQSEAQVTATANGFVVTWTNQDGSGGTPEDPFNSGIRMAAFDNDGVRLALPDQPNPDLATLRVGEFRVNDEALDIQNDASVVGLADGRSVFSYFDDESGETLFEFRDSSGAPLSAEMVAFGANSGTRGLEMFATPDGGFVMVGAAGFSPIVGGGILMQIFDSDLTPGDIIRVNLTGTPGQTRSPEVAVSADGTIHVGWTLRDGVANPEMKLRSFDADGTSISGQISVSGGLNGSDLRALAVGSDGNILAVGETENITSGDDLFMVLLQPDFTPIRADLLPIGTSGDQSSPAIAPLADGKFLVVVNNTEGPGDPDGSDISGIIIGSDGLAIGGEFIVNTTTAFNQRTPDTTVLSDGRVLVTWAGENPGFGQDIFARIFDENGVPQGDDLILNDLQIGNQTLPDVAAAGDGFVVGWLSDQTFDNTTEPNINGAVFDEDFDPVLMPLVLPNNTFSFLREDDILNLQDIPLSGDPDLFFIDAFGDTALGASLGDIGNGVVRYNPFTLAPEIGNLAEGEQLTEIFEYTVENQNGDQVTLVGSFQVQAFEDIIN